MLKYEGIVRHKAASMVGGIAFLFLSLTGMSVSPAAFSQGTPPARSVRVVKGDTLEAIAAREGVSVQELMRLNKITRPEELQIGQQLKLPPGKAVVQVAPGDTLGELASRHGTSVAALQKANPGVKPDQLKVGSWLRLPSGTATAKPKPSATAKPKPSGTATATTKPSAKAAAPAQPAAKAQPPARETPAAKGAAPTPPPTGAAKAATGPAPVGPPPSLPASQKSEPVRWKFFGNTMVDWGGWKLHPGGVRVSLVQPSEADVGPVRSKAAAVAVHCTSLRQAWLVNGVWEPWGVPEPRSVGQKIVLDLCANVMDRTGPSIPPPSAP